MLLIVALFQFREAEPQRRSFPVSDWERDNCELRIVLITNYELRITNYELFNRLSLVQTRLIASPLAIPARVKQTNALQQELASPLKSDNCGLCKGVRR
jgi:hypothetical protein